MANREDGKRRAWEGLVALAGAATAIVIVVYLVGGVVAWERFHILRLPANQAVAPLSRSLLIVEGVRVLAWPVGLGLAAALSTALAIYARSWTTAFRIGTWAALAVAWLAALLAIGVRDHGPWRQHLVFALAIGAAVVVAVVVAGSRPSRSRWAVVGAALAMVGIGIVVETIDIVTLPVRMEYAQVQMTGSRHADGFYVGATSDAVYLAPNKRCHVRGWVLAVPRSDVVSLVVFSSKEAWSRHAHARKCESPP